MLSQGWSPLLYVGIITEWVNDGMKTDYMAHLEELKALQKTWGTVIVS